MIPPILLEIIIRIITLLFALFLSTNAAQAASPLPVSVDEGLIAIGSPEGFLFILREVKGIITQQTDVMLIARNRKTNLDDQIWPVMRMIDSGYNSDERGIEAQIEPLPLKSRVNPFDILLWRKARPLMAMLGNFRKDNAITNFREHSSLTIVSDGEKYRLADNVMAELLSLSLNTTRAAMPPYFVEGQNRGGIDSLLDVVIDPSEECKYHDFNRFYEQEDQGFQDFWIAYVTCESDYAMSYLSMFLMIPKLD